MYIHSRLNAEIGGNYTEAMPETDLLFQVLQRQKTETVIL